MHRFVLVQPEEDVEGSFRYFATPTDKDALGAVVLNKDANLYVAGDESNKPNSFCITSQGIHDPKPITTVLACKTNQDLQVSHRLSIPCADSLSTLS